MCFSAEASFTLGSCLTAIGALSLKKTGFGRGTILACAPLVFALQQYSEGFVWLHLNGTLHSPALLQVAQFFYLLVAWVIWPVYISCALLPFEKKGARKNIMFFCLLLGIGIAAIDFSFMATQSITPKINQLSIDYGTTSSGQHLAYGITTLVPFFVSSIPKMPLVGLVFGLSFALSQLIYFYTFSSTWCFFAAGTSLFLYCIVPAKIYPNNLKICDFGFEKAPGFDDRK